MVSNHKQAYAGVSIPATSSKRICRQSTANRQRITRHAPKGDPITQWSVISSSCYMLSHFSPLCGIGVRVLNSFHPHHLKISLSSGDIIYSLLRLSWRLCTNILCLPVIRITLLNWLFATLNSSNNQFFSIRWLPQEPIFTICRAHFLIHAAHL